MVYIYVHHQVADFATWKEGFDAHASTREAAGATGEVYLMQDVENANDVTAVLGWSDVEKAKAFASTPKLKEAMEKAGVTDPPEVRFLQAAE